MRSGSHILISGLAGAVGGVLVVLLVLNSPAAVRLLSDTDSGTAPLQAVDTTTIRDENRAPYESRVVEAVEKANPAVVSIVISRDVPVIERFYEELPEGGLSPFNDFFNDDFFTPFNLRIPQYRQRGTERQEVGGGSGFLVSREGLVLTNRHVVGQDDVAYTVLTNDGTKYEAEVVARDPVNDLAVLRVQAEGLPFLDLADSDQLQVGQTVIAIGNALAEFRNTVSVGVISGLARSILAGGGRGQPEQLEEVIQTDAAINPGNSGGPLLNLEGQVVGVNVAVALGSQNIGFALPVNLVRDALQSVAETGRIVRPFLGVRYTMITSATQQQNSLPTDYGALILAGEGDANPAVVPGSPADTAGMKEGDIILEMDGVRLDEGTSLASQIRGKSVGDTVALKILREGSELDLTVTLQEIPSHDG